MPAPHRFDPTILREYDIRGIIGKTLSTADARAVGLAFGTVIRRKGGVLFKPADLGAFEKIEGQEAQMCAGIALSMVFPPQMVVVKSPDGAWQVVY